MVEKTNSPNFDAIFSRIQSETGIKSVRQLSEIIGRKHPTVSAAKTKDNFSANWAYELEKKYGLLTGWILTGKGPKRIGGEERRDKYPIIGELEEWILEEIKKDPKKKDWFEVHLLESFPKFEKWKQRKEESESSANGFLSSKIA